MSKKKKLMPIEPKQLIPQGWMLSVTSREEVVALGRANIREMVRWHRRQAAETALMIKRTDEALAIIEGKTIADLQREALESELPIFTSIGYRGNSPSMFLEPLDEVSQSRDANTTTYNVCGWCRHNQGCGTSKNGKCFVVTGCRFLVYSALEGYTDRVFNSLCFVRFEDDAYLDKVRAGLVAMKAEHVTEKQQTDRMIRLLLKLERQSDERPALPCRRPYDWFDVGESAVCYVGRWGGTPVIPGTFVCGEVTNEYGHHEGKVKVVFDRPAHFGDLLEGCGVWWSSHCPQVMKSWEFQYLLENPDFAQIWVHSCAGEFDQFDANQFLADLARERYIRLDGATPLVWEDLDVKVLYDGTVKCHAPYGQFIAHVDNVIQLENGEGGDRELTVWVPMDDLPDWLKFEPFYYEGLEWSADNCFSVCVDGQSGCPKTSPLVLLDGRIVLPLYNGTVVFTPRS